MLFHVNKKLLQFTARHTNDNTTVPWFQIGEENKKEKKKTSMKKTKQRKNPTKGEK